jgi:hypothetical protein
MIWEKEQRMSERELNGLKSAAVRCFSPTDPMSAFHPQRLRAGVIICGTQPSRSSFLQHVVTESRNLLHLPLLLSMAMELSSART